MIHERAFKVTTTYVFPCMVFVLCRSACVPIWNIDQIKTPPATVDIGLIRAEDNELVPRRGPHPEVPPLCENLADIVEQVQADT